MTRNVKLGKTNAFKERIIHNLPYGLDNVKPVLGTEFVKSFSLSGRTYVQAYEVVDFIFKSKETGETFLEEDTVPEGMEVIKVPVIAAKTAVRI